MRDEKTKPSPDSEPVLDPLAASRQALKPALHQRFYTTVEASPRADGYAILLDGRPLMTPAKAALIVPTLAVAAALAEEWREPGEYIDPAKMPLTRIVNSALDGVSRAMDAVSAEIAQYAASDLVCYRADAPESLAKAQAEAWDPVLAFAETDLRARFLCAEGVVHVAQPAASLAAVRDKLASLIGTGADAPIVLACLSTMTTLTGSVLIPLARIGGALTLEESWAAAHVDEDFQMRLWGADQEAMERRGRRFAEMAAADRLWHLLRASGGA